MAGRKVVASIVVIGLGLASGRALVAQGQSAPARSPAAARVLEVIGGQSGWIGVTVRDAGDAEAQRAKLPTVNGVVVDEVTSEGPAQAAGMKAGDVIVEFDGERVRSTRQFSRLVQETPVGRKVPAVIVRDGQRTPMTIEPRVREGMRYFGNLDELPAIARRMMPVPPAPPAPPALPARPAPPAPPAPPAAPRGFFDFEDLLGRTSGRLGVTVAELEPQLADYFGVKDGVLVSSVTPNSAAAKAGIKAGDVITTVNAAAVTSAAELRQRTARLSDGDELSIGIVRERKALTLKGKAEAPAERRRAIVL